MISKLSVKNFAIIKDLNIDFHEGLNILTGETGSGKSIIIEAIHMALGGRSDSDYVRTGCSKAVIQLVIDDREFDEPVILTREIFSGGRSTGRINDEIVTNARLSSFSKNFVDIHGQYDNQALLNKDNHISILDSYNINDIYSAKKNYSTAYSKYRKISDELSELNTNVRESLRKKDFMEYELNEIIKVSPRPEEDMELSEKLNILQNSEKIFSSARGASDLLYSSENSCSELLRKASNELAKIESLSARFGEMKETVDDCYYRLEEIASGLSEYTDSIDFSTEEIDALISRQEKIEDLKRKYGGSIDDIIMHRSRIEKALSDFDNFDFRKGELEKQLQSQYELVFESASVLSSLRNEAAAHLEKSVTSELQELNFKNSIFKVDFKESIGESGRPVFTENGYDEIEFLISTNKGEALKPLAKIASGGEISRIMLAFKRITGRFSSVPTFIFDEIDTGISGNAAEVVGGKLSRIASEHQIICITHLPQIAVMGDFHYIINKHSDDNETFTTVDEINGEALIKEIARLSGSSHLTESSRQNAIEMISFARSEKEQFSTGNN